MHFDAAGEKSTVGEENENLRAQLREKEEKEAIVERRKHERLAPDFGCFVRSRISKFKIY